MRTLPFLLVVSACWVTDSEIETKLIVEIDTGEVNPLVLTSVSPTFGPNNGGTQVLIVVGPLVDDNPVVQIGGVTAPIVSQDQVSITVQSPAFVGTGTVAIDIADGGRTIRSEDAYTYYEDNSGMNGVVGGLAYIEYVGDSWGTQLERPDDYGYGWLSFVQPTNVTYAQMFYGTGMDTCQSEYVWNGQLTDQPIGAALATLRTGANSLELPFDATSRSFEADLTIAQYRPGSVFDLDAFDSQAFPAFPVPAIARTPLPFSVTQPEFDTFIGSNFEVTWTTAETGDWAFIRVDLWDNFSSSFVETVRCVVVDDGRFQMASSDFSQWVAFGQTARISVGRVFESDAVLAHDGSSSGVVGVYQVIGLADTDI